MYMHTCVYTYYIHTSIPCIISCDNERPMERHLPLFTVGKGEHRRSMRQCLMCSITVA